MKQLRQMRRKFGLHTAPMAVRVHVPWYWRWAGLGAACVAVAGAVWWLVTDQYRESASVRAKLEQELAAVTKAKREFETQNTQLRSQLAALQRQATIDRTSQDELKRSLAQAQDEALRMKEDLRFFQSGLFGEKTKGGVSINTFKVERDGQANRYRYRVLVTQKGLKERDFKGRAQLKISLEQNGNVDIITVPQQKNDTQFELNFKYYQQLEGTFNIADGAVEAHRVRSV